VEGRGGNAACLYSTHLLVMERGGSAKRGLGWAIYPFMRVSGRGDTSANGNPTHVCVRHLRVNGADGRNGRMSWQAKTTLPFQGSAHVAWSMLIDGTQGQFIRSWVLR
jgi:hypothetical protein